MSKQATTAIAKLRQQGKSIPAWAKENGFPTRAVRAVLYGHNKGKWGQAHHIALKLGIKAQDE